MTPEERAKALLESLVCYQTSLGSFTPGLENDPNHWRPEGCLGESYSTIHAAIREAVAAEREACAKVAAEVAVQCGYANGDIVLADMAAVFPEEVQGAQYAAEHIAAAIRARP